MTNQQIDFTKADQRINHHAKQWIGFRNNLTDALKEIDPNWHLYSQRTLVMKCRVKDQDFIMGYTNDTKTFRIRTGHKLDTTILDVTFDNDTLDKIVKKFREFFPQEA